MRVIAGSARGRKLKTLEGMEVRPTTDKVKEAIFSSIQFEVPHASVLDLFAGSGQMGIEAISRGAAAVTFVDCSAKSLQVTRENLHTLGFSHAATIHQTDAASFLRATTQKFHIAILDPPYRKNLLSQLLPLLVPCMTSTGFVICEHETGLMLPDSIGSLQKQKSRRYGAISVTIYQNTEGEQ